MKNINKIKAMDINDLVGFILNVEYNNYDFTYSDVIEKWLLQEEE